MAILKSTLIAGSVGSGVLTGNRVPSKADETKMVDEVAAYFQHDFNGHGWKIYPETDANGKATGYYCLEVDDLVVRRSMYVFELVVQKIRSVNGAIVVSQGNGKIKEAELGEDGYWRITLEDEMSPFVKDDFMMCQQFKNGSIYGYYVHVNDVTDEGVILVADDEFAAPDTTADKGAWSSINHPSVGDEVVQIGNKANTKRQSVIYIHANESDGKPAIDVMDGISSRAAFRNGDGMRVRLGGALPDAPDTTNGLWVKNGTIMSVDDKKRVGYQFNPDGSFSLASGVITYTHKDGLTMDFSKTPELRGEAITMALSASSVIAKQSEVAQTYTVRLRMYNNSEVMKAVNPAFIRNGSTPTSGYMLTANAIAAPTGLTTETKYGTDYIDLSFTIAADTSVDFDYPVTVSLLSDGSTRSTTIPIRTIADGQQGEAGTSFEIKGHAVGCWEWSHMEQTMEDAQSLPDVDWKADALYLVNNNPDGYNVVAYDKDRNMTTRLTASKGDAYVVNIDSSLSEWGRQGNDGHIYSWGDGEWVDLGQLTGADGEDAYVVEVTPSVIAMEMEAKKNSDGETQWQVSEKDNTAVIRVRHGKEYATLQSVRVLDEDGCTAGIRNQTEQMGVVEIDSVDMQNMGKDVGNMPVGRGRVIVAVTYKADTATITENITIPFTVAATLYAAYVHQDVKSFRQTYEAWKNGENGRMAGYFSTSITQSAEGIAATATATIEGKLTHSGMYIYADHIDVDADKFNLGEKLEDGTFWPYIAIGKDALGPYFKFLNKDGSEAYNLGFTGLAELIANTTKAHFDEGEYHYRVADSYDFTTKANPDTIMNDGYSSGKWNRYYQFTPQSTINTSTKERIYAPIEGASYDGKYFEDNSVIQYLPDASSMVADGVYATRPLVGGTQYLNFYDIRNGKRTMLSSYTVYQGVYSLAYLSGGLHKSYKSGQEVPVFQSKDLT